MQTDHKHVIDSLKPGFIITFADATRKEEKDIREYVRKIQRSKKKHTSGLRYRKQRNILYVGNMTYNVRRPSYW